MKKKRERVLSLAIGQQKTLFSRLPREEKTGVKVGHLCLSQTTWGSAISTVAPSYNGHQMERERPPLAIRSSKEWRFLSILKRMENEKVDILALPAQSQWLLAHNNGTFPGRG
jgi:hypothetical protein